MELDDIDFHSRFCMNKRCFCNLLDRIELELRHAAESHGGLLPIQQLVAIVEFYLYPTVGTVLIHSVKPELTE